MSSTFNGFSEEDIQRLKSEQNHPSSGKVTPLPPNTKKLDQIGAKPRRVLPKYKLPLVIDDQSDVGALDVSFDKCKLSLKTPTDVDNGNAEQNTREEKNTDDNNATVEENCNKNETRATEDGKMDGVRVKPDVVSSTDGTYSEATSKAHSDKLEELQVKQKLMEEQNRKRKEMLSKALADRTKQTEEEVLKLEKIKKELQVLDGQLSQDVAVLRKKIDQACLTYADAEKHYLRIEREFLQSKLNLQKEKEKKELLTEHLCALITHNETRKAQKLVTLMEQLAFSGDIHDNDESGNTANEVGQMNESAEITVVDGVDERTGKMVEVNDNFS